MRTAVCMLLLALPLLGRSGGRFSGDPRQPPGRSRRSADVTVHDRRGNTPLMYAAAFGSVEAVRLLIDAGADVNARNGFDATPLIWAAGNLAKARLLLEHGADVNAHTNRAGRR